jgi:hypothetical protein
MKKIRLDIDALEVSTFVAEPEEKAVRGTVKGHATALCSIHVCATGLYRTAPCDTCEIASCVETCTNPNRPMC